jgi:hypothetical protein
VKTAVISQSNYIPWKGYFDLINSADIFVIYDVVQFTKNDWRNRNQIIINGSPRWLTIPVKHQSLTQRIEETLIASPHWAKKHWLTIEQNYRKTPGFEIYGEEIRTLYRTIETEPLLSKVNEAFIKTICKILGIKTKIIRASEYSLPEDRIGRIISLCKQLNCDTYLSGPAAKNYLSPQQLQNAGIELRWMDYNNYPRYHQRSQTYSHSVSVLDLLFNTAGQHPNYFKTTLITGQLRQKEHTV